MFKMVSIALVAVSALTLSGCSETTSQAKTDPSAATGAELRTGNAADEQACLDKVAEQTGNTVELVSSDASEANTEVMVAVGPDKAKWSCLSSGGQVAQIMSLTDEGAF